MDEGLNKALLLNLMTAVAAFADSNGFAHFDAESLREGSEALEEWSSVRVRYVLEKAESEGYLKHDGDTCSYTLEQPGVEYIVEHDLDTT